MTTPIASAPISCWPRSGIGDDCLSLPELATLNGVRLAYDRAGQGFPMLLVHGFPRDRRLWRKLVPLLAGRFDTVALDRRGYGDSDRPPDHAAYASLTMANDARDLTRLLGWRRVLLVGHDLGLAMVQRLILEAPELVAGAVCLDGLPLGVSTDAPRDPSGRTWYFDFFRQRGVAEPLIGQNPRLFFSLFLARHAHLTPDEHAMFLEPYCRAGSVEAVLADYRHRLEDDRRFWADVFKSGQRLAVPVCALWAGRGPAANLPVLDAWRSVAVNVRGAEIDNTAHYLQEEQPAEVARHIHAFADELGLSGDA
jgi:pimeloyl-ACP methyl ester carboxylesterase